MRTFVACIGAAVTGVALVLTTSIATASATPSPRAFPATAGAPSAGPVEPSVYSGHAGGLHAGNHDNFGFGQGNPVPCEFYDLSGTRDLGVFDRELSGGGDAIDRWRHSFKNDLPAGFTAAKVIISIREFFSDDRRSTVVFDGVAFNFVAGTPSECSAPVLRTFTLTGADAAIADDGAIHVAFHENGDNIVLDYSDVRIVGQDGTVVG